MTGLGFAMFLIGVILSFGAGFMAGEFKGRIETITKMHIEFMERNE